MSKALLLFFCFTLSFSIKILEYKETNAFAIKDWTQIIEFDFSNVPSDIKGDGGHRMQNFVFSGNYIYGCVRYLGKSGNHSDNAILKFNYPTSGKKATFTGELMRVLNAGHGETLDMYKNYIVMGLKGKNNSGKETDNFFSTQIGIFKFVNGKQVNYTQLTRISHLNEAKMEGGETVNMGNITRVIAGVKDNLLTVRVTIENGGYTWTTYDLDKIASFIDLQQPTHMQCGEINKIPGAYLYSFDSGTDKKSGYASFQGLESYGDNLYVSSGQGGIDGKVEPARITVFNRQSGQMYDGYELKNGNITINEIKYEIKNVETQGLKFQGSNLFVMLDQTKTKIGIVKITL